MSNAAPRKWSLKSPTRRRALIRAECAAAAERRIRYAAFSLASFPDSSKQLSPGYPSPGLFSCLQTSCVGHLKAQTF
jgi:hypothetical protein